LDELASLPVGISGWASLGAEVGSLLVETSALASGGSETTHFSVLLGVVDDPVDSRVVSDGGMGWVNKDDFEPFVNGVLANPVRVQNSKRTALTSNSLFGKRSQVSDKLLLSDTGVLGLTVVDTLGNTLLAVTSLHSNSVDNIPLLGLVSKSVGLIRSRWLASSVDSWQLSVLPGADSEDESHHVGLLLVPQLLKILVRSHLSRTSLQGRKIEIAEKFGYRNF
jgi:hypothetical protein